MTQAGTVRRRAQPIHFVTSVAFAALLAGCQAGGGGGFSLGAEATRAAPTNGAATLASGDVEAPEVFSAEDGALWDGRPSLGGVWVAAEEVREPHRVVIRNPANGKFIVGALFKREHAGTGPALQLSSDAAAALGIVAGQPTDVSVVALREAPERDSTPALAPEPPAPLGPEAAEGEVEAAPTADDILDGEAAGAVAEAGTEVAADALETLAEVPAATAFPPELVSAATAAAAAAEAAEAAALEAGTIEAPADRAARLTAEAEAAAAANPSLDLSAAPAPAVPPLEIAPDAAAEAADAGTFSLEGRVAAAVAATEAAEAAQAEGAAAPATLSEVETTALGTTASSRN